MGLSEMISAWGSAAKKALLAVGVGAAIAAQGTVALAAESTPAAPVASYESGEQSGRLIKVMSVKEQAELADKDASVTSSAKSALKNATETSAYIREAREAAAAPVAETVAPAKPVISSKAVQKSVATDTAKQSTIVQKMNSAPQETVKQETVAAPKAAPKAISSEYARQNDNDGIPPLRYITEKVERKAAVAPVPVKPVKIAEPVASPAPEAVQYDYRRNNGVDLEVRYFVTNMNSTVGSNSISFNGGRVNFRDDLGFDGKKAPEFLLRYGRLGIDYLPVHETANTTIGAGTSFVYKGNNYQGDVRTKSKFDYIKIDMTNPINEAVYWQYGVAIMKWKGSVTGKVNGTGNEITESESYNIAVPMVGVGLQAPLAASDKVKAHAKIAGLPLGGRGHFYDFEVGLDYNPAENVGITLGYRRIKVAYNRNDDHARISLHGPYLGVHYSF